MEFTPLNSNFVSSEHSSTSEDSADIHHQWKKQEQEKKENALLLMQGNRRYKNEDETVLHKIKQKATTIDQFYFDPKITKEERFLEFKTNVIGRAFVQDDDDEEEE